MDQTTVIDLDDSDEAINDKVAPKTDPTVVDTKADDAAELRKELDALRKERDDAKRQAAEAERIARERLVDVEKANAERVTARTAEQNVRYSSIVQGIAAADADAKQAETEQARLLESGQFAQAAQAAREVAKAEARKLELERAKENLEFRAEQAKRQPDIKPISRDPVEAYIANSNASPAVAKWVRSHPEFVTDSKLQNKVLAAHHAAMAEGIQPESAEYFEAIEARMGDDPPAKTPSKTPNSGRKTMPQAPVSRDVASARGDASGGRVELSPGEMARATDGTLVWNKGPNKGKPIGVREFARRKSEMQKAGYYER